MASPAQKAKGCYAKFPTFHGHHGWEEYPVLITGKTNEQGHWEIMKEDGGFVFTHPSNLKELHHGAVPKFQVGAIVEWQEPIFGGRDYAFYEGTVVNVKIWSHRVVYFVQPKDGSAVHQCSDFTMKSISSFKAPKRSEADFLRDEEARLMAQLAQVQTRLQRL